CSGVASIVPWSSWTGRPRRPRDDPTGRNAFPRFRRPARGGERDGRPRC
ncbi:MAG: hypothetical protein AVDCRST_MAG64-2394, partial [uncultured Phycisphaerae bacterium]